MVAKAEETIPEGHVKVRVMKRGDDKIYTGEEFIVTKGEHFPRFPKNAEIMLPKATAEKYEEEFGWVEVLP